MKLSEFLAELTEMLEVEEEVTAETSLEDMEEYDSLAIMSLIAFIDEKFDMTASGETLGELKTVADLISLIGPENVD